MAVVNGADFLLKIRQSATLAAVVDPAPPNTGNGTITGHSGRSMTATETITFLCVVAGGAGVGVFSITGSVSGLAGYAVVGQPFYTDIIDGTVTAGATPYIVGDNFTIAATVGALVTVGAMNRYSKNGSTDEQNFPTFGGTKYVVPGDRNVSYSVGGFLDTTDVGQAELRRHELLKSPIVLQVLFDGANGFQHVARPRSFSHEAGAEGGLQPVTFEFAGLGSAAAMIGTGPIF